MTFFSRTLLATVAIASLLAPGFSQIDLQERLTRVLEQSPVSQQSFVGVQVLDTESGNVLFEQYPDQFFTPASNAKLYSSAAALDIFGPDHKFETYVGITGTIANEKLTGDLYLIGRGDPVLTTDDLLALASRVSEEAGIREISGDLIIDVSLFNSAYKGPGWMWDDNPDTYSMSISALMLDYNVTTIKAFLNDQGLLAGELIPKTSYPPVIVNREEGYANISRAPFRAEFTVTGNQVSSNGSASVSRTLAVYDPPLWIGNVFKEMLLENGVQFSGMNESQSLFRPTTVKKSEVVLGKAPNSMQIVLKQETRPMSEVVALFNKPSENAIGEMLWHHLALQASSYPANWSNGATAMQEWLDEKAGIALGSLRLVDGSGLSRYNQITPRTTTTLLQAMWNHPSRQVYIDSLPNSSQDGTLGSRMKSGVAAGRVHAKTGTMSGVSCLSGYVQNANGDWRTFSILVNGYIGSSAPARELQDQLCEELAVMGIQPTPTPIPTPVPTAEIPRDGLSTDTLEVSPEPQESALGITQ